MKYSVITITIIAVIFLLAQFIGLGVNNHYLQEDSELPYGIKPLDTENFGSPWFFVGMIIFATLLFFLFKKLQFDSLVKVWFFFALVTGISITLSVLIEPFLALIVAVVLVLMKFHEQDLYTHNIVELLLYGGIVAIFIPVLNVISIIAILVIMSIYDFISVFITKHMIVLAKMQEKLGIFSGLIVTNKGEAAILGGGDIAFTLLFASVLLRDFGSLSALLAVYGSLAGILTLMFIGKKKKFYPAMPFVTIGSLLGFGLSLII